MPKFDGTGPMGRGPLTGRGMGYCAARLPSEADTGPSVGRPQASRSGGFSYPSRGLRDFQELRFAPGPGSFGRLPSRGFQHGRALSIPFAHKED